MKKTALLVTAVLLFTVACKKTVESEKKAWDRNLKKIESLSFEYPNFKNALQEQRKKAEAVMKAADSITKEEDKIKKMAEANKTINAAFVSNLSSIKSQKQSLRDKIVSVRGLKMEMNERFAVNRAISDADRAVMDAEDKIRQDIENISQAESLTSLVLSDLKAADASLESASRRVKDRIASEKRIEDEKKQVVQKQEADKKELAKPIKCPYCGTINAATNINCKSCGAPLPKKKI